MAALFFLILGVFLIATAASGLIAYGIVSAVGLGGAWRVVLSAIAATLPMVWIYSTTRGPLDVSSALKWSLVPLGVWAVIVFLLEGRRARKAKRRALLACQVPQPIGTGTERL